jgi:arginine decarboxylase
VLSSRLSIDTKARDSGNNALRLAEVIKRFRPELDIIVLADTKPEAMIADPAAAGIRRIFYEVEEPLEIHLSILSGVAERNETPFFDNLKKYAQKPVGTFHALPVARGKSIFKSNWISDMGEFYGANLFLAESSATSGGLDSLLEPTGNIKKAQDAAARAFGADRVFFVTNGTSTSNKMVHQALLQPGDIVIADRNCHKSHHYGMVLAGAQPYYVEAFPMVAYSMYGAVPIRSLKKALLDLKAAGRLDKVKTVTLTNCTFDGHVYDVRRVMEECLAIKSDLIFLWDEAWFGFARFSPLYRPRTAMGARADLKEAFADPASARTSTPRTHVCSTPGLYRIRARPSCASTRRTRRTSRCPRCDRARWCWWPTRTTTSTSRPSRRQCSLTPRHPPTSRSSRRSTWRAGRWSWRVTGWSCRPSSSRSKFAPR